MVACGDDGFCVEQRVTIAEGLYGFVTYQTDVSPQSNPPRPVAGEGISVLDAPNGNVVTSTTSDDAGVFQVDLDAGSYALCSLPSAPCVTFTIANGQLVRADLEKGFGGAFWAVVPRSDCAE
jgi:hypothetical protein